jgi:uncharacterized membrane protein YvlD (DUF360 family)
LLRFVSYWVVNSIILSLASSLFPNGFEMGNAYLSIPLASILSGFLLTAILLIARGLARSIDLPKRGRYIMFVYYWVAASVGIWIIARIASVSGFGIARYYWAIGAALITAFIHWGVRQALKGIKLI